MKAKILELSLFLFTLIGVLSCNVEPLDSDIEPIDPGTSNASFSVQFNNSAYETNNVSASLLQGNLTITAENNTGAFVMLIEGEEKRTYSEDELTLSYVSTSEDVYISDENATLTISAINYQQKTISGTFSFTGVEFSDAEEPATILFTEGTFTNVPVTGDLVNPNPEEPEEPEEPGEEDPEEPEEPEEPQGDYYPMAVGNIWNYNSTSSEIISTATIGGNSYYQLEGNLFLPSGHSSEIYVRKGNGDYHLRIENQTFLMGGYDVSISTAEYVILKDYLNEGDTWEETLSLTHSFIVGGEETSPTTVDTNYHHTILEKDVTAIVSGVSYDEVIKVKTVTSAPQYIQTETETWYAKNIGVVYRTSTGSIYGQGFSTTATLSDYTLD